MEIKYGQIYVGKKSGDRRIVVGTTETHEVYLLQNLDQPEYQSEWSKEQLEKCCTLELHIRGGKIMEYYFNANKEYKTKPILVELTEESGYYELGTKAWFNKEEDDLWIIDPDGIDIIEIDGVKYGTTLLWAHDFNFKPVADSVTKVGLDRINDLAFELMHIEELDDVFLKARRITEIVNQLLEEEAK